MEYEEDERLDEMFPYDEIDDDVFPTGTLAVVFDMIDIRKKLETLGLMVANYLIYQSNSSSDKEKDFALYMLNIYRNLFYYGKIDKMIFQTGVLTGKPEKRGSFDCTTRFEILFSLHNTDKYILRMEMPHKGQNNIHINIDEIIVNDNVAKVVSSSFPLSRKEDINKVESVLGKKFKELFYHQENIIWFKANFKEKVKRTISDKSIQDALYGLFDERSHYSEQWKYDEIEEEDVLKYLNKVKGIVEKWDYYNLREIYFVKANEEMTEAIVKLRWIDHFKELLFGLLCTEEELKKMSRINIKKMIWLLFDKAKNHPIMWQGRRLSQEEFMKKDLLTICRWIMELENV